jgi:hypothetical protein
MVYQLINLRVFSAVICVSFFPADSRGKGLQIFSFFTPMIYQIIKKNNSSAAADRLQSRKGAKGLPSVGRPACRKKIYQSAGFFCEYLR